MFMREISEKAYEDICIVSLRQLQLPKTGVMIVNDYLGLINCCC